MYNEIIANGGANTIAGGLSNTIQPDSSVVTIAGGSGNRVEASTTGAAIGGGGANRIEADSAYSTIAGGTYNTIGSTAYWATVVGGHGNLAGGDLSFAAGRRARATHAGSFVWCDSLDQDGGSQGNNTFTVRASGGTFFFSSAGNTGVRLSAGSGSWDTLNDRASKTNFAAVNVRDVLERVAALPMESWNYAAQDPSIRHLGPMAQDFQAAFGLGADNKTIATVDADGVALAAIQGLNEKLEDRGQKSEARIQRLEAENAAPREKLNTIKALLKQFTTANN
jgi:hypothetical protein